LTDPSQKWDGVQGDRCIHLVLKSIHTLTSELWNARNSTLHESTKPTLTSIRSTEEAEIRYFHCRPQLLHFDDRYYCNRPLDKLLSGSSSVRRRWLRSVKGSVKTQEADGSRQTLMTQFYSPKA
jgi:hypothetical protein